jgi:NADH-quinone oxidoreductase subunit C
MGALNQMSEQLPEWVKQVKEKFGDKIRGLRERSPKEYEFVIDPENNVEFLMALKTLPQGPFDHLSDLTAYDEHPKTPRFHVVYELISMAQKKRAAVVAVLEDDKQPKIETICDLWAGANWLEREVWDMMGIHFENHPDHRRLLMPEMFKGHPLRKDFDVNYRQEYPTARSKAPGFNPYLEGENA